MKKDETIAPYGIGLAAMILASNFYGYGEDIELAHKHILGESIQPVMFLSFEETDLASRDAILKANLAKEATEMAMYVIEFYNKKTVLDYPIEFKDSKWVIGGLMHPLECQTLTEAIARIIGISI